MFGDKPPVPEEEQLKALDQTQIKEDIEKVPVPEGRSFDIATIMTPAEHKLIGSTFYGLAYHSNVPKAYSAGFSLAEINEARASAEQSFYFFPTDEDENKQILLISVNLKSLTEEQVRDNNFIDSFEIIEAKDIWGKPTDLPAGVIQHFRENIEGGKLTAKAELEKKLQANE
jgi:hypothetical protein